MRLDRARLTRDPAVLVRETWGDVLHTGRFWLYGAGNVGKRLLAALNADGRPVGGFIDNNPALQDREVNGVRVWPHDQISPGQDDVCVVTIWNYHHDFARSAEHARSLGFRTVMHFSALAVLGDYGGVFPNYAVDHPSVVFSETFEDDYRSLQASLADEASRALADQVLSFHALPTPENLPPLSDRPLPFEAGAIATYVDCGAFVGDDFEQRRGVFTSLKKAYLIEPDPETYDILMARKFPGLDVTPIHAAASDRPGATRFAASGTWGSKIADDGGIDVECLTLDSLALQGAGPVYVKMDVEGHELAVLRGAAGLLADHSTVFCVTLEHRARDLFDVPRLLSAYAHRRNYLFANDTEFAMDLVIYSVPS